MMSCAEATGEFSHELIRSSFAWFLFFAFGCFFFFLINLINEERRQTNILQSLNRKGPCRKLIKHKSAEAAKTTATFLNVTTTAIQETSS